MTVVPLEIQLDEAERQLENKKAEIAEAQRECAALLTEKRSIEEMIAARDAAGRVNLEITDHAVVRYMERVKGINIREIKNEILASCSHAKGFEDAAEFNVFKGDHKLVVKNSKVITVLDRK